MRVRVRLAEIPLPSTVSRENHQAPPVLRGPTSLGPQGASAARAKS